MGRHTNTVLNVKVVLQTLENAADGTWNHSTGWMIGRPGCSSLKTTFHCVGLSGTSLSIGKDSAVETVQCLFHCWVQHPSVHISLSGCRRKCSVKRVCFCGCSGPTSRQVN